MWGKKGTKATLAVARRTPPPHTHPQRMLIAEPKMTEIIVILTSTINNLDKNMRWKHKYPVRHSTCYTQDSDTDVCMIFHHSSQGSRRMLYLQKRTSILFRKKNSIRKLEHEGLKWGCEIAQPRKQSLFLALQSSNRWLRRLQRLRFQFVCVDLHVDLIKYCLQTS